VRVSGVRVRLSLDMSASLEIRSKLVYRHDGRVHTVALSSRRFSGGRAHDLRLSLPAKLGKLLPFGTSVEVKLQVTAIVTGARACAGPQVEHASLHTHVARLYLPRS
jgi:hypothetical protein